MCSVVNKLFILKLKIQTKKEFSKLSQEIFMKNYFFITFILTAIFFINPEENVIVANKIAKVGNELILKKDVDVYSKFFNLTFDDAKKRLINAAILYTGAKMYIKEPSAEEINNYFKKEKAIYASRVGKEAKNVTDDEFIKNLNLSHFSIVSYKNEIKKEIWINKYINETVINKKLNQYSPSEEEINNLIKTEPELVQEREGIFFSMIYFSFYNEKGILKNGEERQKLYKTAQDCLNELSKSFKFEAMVDKYSDDLVSKNNDPKGRAGFMAFDDPKAVINFSADIINELKNSNLGIVFKIFLTKNGYYIFRIDEKIKPKILTGDEAKLKAETILKTRFDSNLREKVINDLLNEVKDKIEIIIY